jgi:BASS family bile acid:Na+ symporter
MTSTSAIVLGASLIIIMFGMGLSLTIDDFKRVVRYPKAMFIGLVNQLILLPAIGFALIFLFPVEPDIAIGLILLAACPGGPTSNLITHLAKGDTALSVSLTAVSSVITVFTIPLVVNLGLLAVLGQGSPFQLEVLQTIGQVFVIVIIPVSLGMLIKAKKSAFADRMDRPVRLASGVVFVLVILGILLKEKANIIPYFEQAGLLALSLNVATMALGFLMAALFGLSREQEVSISIESGIQNGTLAISIATVLLENSAFAIAPAIYGLIMFFTGGAMIYWANRRSARVVETI